MNALGRLRRRFVIATAVASVVLAGPWPATIANDARAVTPVWFTAGGARKDVATALDALRHAAEHGLDPDDYDVPLLERRVAAAQRRTGDPHAIASADVALTAAVLRFASDLRFGRVDPATVAPQFRAPRRDGAFAAGLRDAVAGERLAQALAAAKPGFPLYSRLEKLLAHYRALAREPLASLPPLPAGRKVAVGDRYDGLAVVRERLLRYGDLQTDAVSLRGDRYSPALAVAIRRFQMRHGLEVDGVIGRNTLAALAVPPADRVAQIAVALERLRWLPDFGTKPIVAINIPSFRLWAFGDPSRGNVGLSTPVIVGEAMRSQTPIFIGEMRSVEFHPYWNVPRSIVRNELLPTIRRDRSYLQREDMELVGPGGEVESAVDDAALAALAAGKLRVRQRPGPKNALGRIKFVLPNTMDVYLHDTPARQLFARSRRDFSHGCIRVGDPVALAAFVL
ncbi:MAG TPA: L,D-transpeptidase family protein, partial [Casimicrobiaceae bacterium]